MSRIRDALRRAEQEKGRGRSSPAPDVATVPATSPPAAVPAPVKPAATGSASAIAAASTVAGHAPAARPAGSVSVATLLDSCRRPLWLGDSAKLLLLGSSANTVATEQLRSLRARLTEMRSRRALKTVAISSALDSEGKTFLAANLAHAFARQHDRKILLVDADLRRPGLHSLLGAPAEPGLSEYFRGAATEEQILQRGPQENLFFIPGGRPAVHPGDLLAGGKLKKLLERLTALFDWILVDAPAAAEQDAGKAESQVAPLIASGCDGVLLVIEAGGTPRKAAQRAAREFPKDRLLGVVLNRAAVS